MTPLRQKMIRELELHRKSPRTVHAYVTAVAQLAQHYGRSPDTISIEEVREFLHYLITQWMWVLLGIDITNCRCCGRHCTGKPSGRRKAHQPVRPLDGTGKGPPPGTPPKPKPAMTQPLDYPGTASRPPRAGGRFAPLPTRTLLLDGLLSSFPDRIFRTPPQPHRPTRPATPTEPFGVIAARPPA
jgi:hypothetical protein